MPESDIGLIAAARPISALQIGLNWFGSEASGGLDRVYADLVTALPAYGVNIAGAVVGPPDVARLTAGRLRAFAPAGAGFAQRLLGARRTIAQMTGKVDLVAAHFALHAATALDRLRGRPFVFHFHGPWADEALCEGGSRSATTAKRMVERMTYRRADRVIVLSRAFGHVVTRRYGVREDRVRVVPGSVDLARFGVSTTREAAREALGWPLDRPILLTVRRLARRMGLDRLIEAVPRIAAAVPEVLVCIAGRGPMEAELRRRVAERQLERHVRFLGFLPDAMLPIAYRAADINVVPTTDLEGFGLTAAESLAAGTPSMVTPIGGLPEVVADLSPDLVFTGCEPEDLAEGLIGALRGGRRLPNAAECRIYATERFDIAVAAARVAGIYHGLVE